MKYSRNYYRTNRAQSESKENQIYQSFQGTLPARQSSNSRARIGLGLVRQRKVGDFASVIKSHETSPIVRQLNSARVREERKALCELDQQEQWGQNIQQMRPRQIDYTVYQNSQRSEVSPDQENVYALDQFTEVQPEGHHSRRGSDYFENLEDEVVDDDLSVPTIGSQFCTAKKRLIKDTDVANVEVPRSPLPAGYSNSLLGYLNRRKKQAEVDFQLKMAAEQLLKEDKIKPVGPSVAIANFETEGDSEPVDQTESMKSSLIPQQNIELQIENEEVKEVLVETVGESRQSNQIITKHTQNQKQSGRESKSESASINSTTMREIKRIEQNLLHGLREQIIQCMQSVQREPSPTPSTVLSNPDSNQAKIPNFGHSEFGSSQTEFSGGGSQQQVESQSQQPFQIGSPPVVTQDSDETKSSKDFLEVKSSCDNRDESQIVQNLYTLKHCGCQYESASGLDDQSAIFQTFQEHMCDCEHSSSDGRPEVSFQEESRGSPCHTQGHMKKCFEHFTSGDKREACRLYYQHLQDEEYDEMLKQKSNHKINQIRDSNPQKFDEVRASKYEEYQRARQLQQFGQQPMCIQIQLGIPGYPQGATRQARVVPVQCIPVTSGEQMEVIQESRRVSEVSDSKYNHDDPSLRDMLELKSRDKSRTVTRKGVAQLDTSSRRESYNQLTKVRRGRNTRNLDHENSLNYSHSEPSMVDTRPDTSKMSQNQTQTFSTQLSKMSPQSKEERQIFSARGNGSSKLQHLVNPTQSTAELIKMTAVDPQDQTQQSLSMSKIESHQEISQSSDFRNDSAIQHGIKNLQKVFPNKNNTKIQNLKSTPSFSDRQADCENRFATSASNRFMEFRF